MMINKILDYPSNTLVPAITIALATTPYVRYLPDSIDIKHYYIDIITNCTDILTDNSSILEKELTSKIVENSFTLFELRYQQAIHPDANSILNSGELLTSKCLELFYKENLPDPELVKILLEVFQQAVMDGIVLEEHTLLGLAKLTVEGAL